MAVGTATWTAGGVIGSMNRVTVDWVANSSGAVSMAAADAYKAISGRILRIVLVPDGGATAPTTAYDVVLNSSRGVDLLHGTGMNASGTVASTSIGEWAVGGPVRLGVTNAGASNGGEMDIYWR